MTCFTASASGTLHGVLARLRGPPTEEQGGPRLRQDRRQRTAALPAPHLPRSPAVSALSQAPTLTHGCDVPGSGTTRTTPSSSGSYQRRRHALPQPGGRARACGTMQNEQKLPQPRMTDRYADVAPCGRSGAMSAARRRTRFSGTLTQNGTQRSRRSAQHLLARQCRLCRSGQAAP